MIIEIESIAINLYAKRNDDLYKFNDIGIQIHNRVHDFIDHQWQLCLLEKPKDLQLLSLFDLSIDSVPFKIMDKIGYALFSSVNDDVDFDVLQAKRVLDFAFS